MQKVDLFKLISSTAVGPVLYTVVKQGFTSDCDSTITNHQIIRAILNVWGLIMAVIGIML